MQTVYSFEIAGFSGYELTVDALKSRMEGLISRFQIAKGTEYRIYRGEGRICKIDREMVVSHSAKPSKIGRVGE